MVSVEGFCILIILPFSLLSLSLLSFLPRVLYSHMQYKLHLVTVYIAVLWFYSHARNDLIFNVIFHNDKGQKVNKRQQWWCIHTEISPKQITNVRNTFFVLLQYNQYIRDKDVHINIAILVQRFPQIIPVCKTKIHSNYI